MRALSLLKLTQLHAFWVTIWSIYFIMGTWVSKCDWIYLIKVRYFQTSQRLKRWVNWTQFCVSVLRDIYYYVFVRHTKTCSGLYPEKNITGALWEAKRRLNVWPPIFMFPILIWIIRGSGKYIHEAWMICDHLNQPISS